MAKVYPEGEQGKEFVRLYTELVEATKLAGAVLKERGMSSPEFAEANRVVGGLWRKRREFTG